MMHLEFLHGNPHVTSVLVGSKQPEHLRRNLELLELEMDAEILKRAVEIG